MERLALTLGAAIAASAATLHTASAYRHEPPHEGLRARLAALMLLAEPPCDADFARALERAV
ncbi:MAG: hypothetical protein H7Y32_00985, partial [Chloroflexales bacterium]|nr:hypothetical protein [Chloroflexales bacterium]